MRNRAERVRGLIDQMADGHSDILSDLGGFNTNELMAYDLDEQEKFRLAEFRGKVADRWLKAAAETVLAQARRLENIAWELGKVR